MINDLKHFHGQETARRALEIAAVGRHSVLLEAPRGQGKSTLIRLFEEASGESAMQCNWIETVNADAEGFKREAFSICVQMQPLTASDWVLPTPAEGSTEVKRRIERAKERRLHPGVKTLPGDSQARELLADAFEKLALSPADALMVEAVATTIAAMDGSSKEKWRTLSHYGRVHVAEALAYRHQPRPVSSTCPACGRATLWLHLSTGKVFCLNGACTGLTVPGNGYPPGAQIALDT